MVGGQVGPNFWTSVDHIEHLSWNSGLDVDICKILAIKRRKLTCFMNHGVAGSQTGSGLPQSSRSFLISASGYLSYLVREDKWKSRGTMKQLM